MTPREALDQARAAAAKIQALEDEGEALFAAHPDPELTLAVAEHLQAIGLAIGEQGSLLAEAFAVLDSVLVMQERSTRPWWRFWGP